MDEKGTTSSLFTVAFFDEILNFVDKINKQWVGWQTLFHRNFELNSMGVLKQIAEYLYLRKPDPNRPNTDFIRKMHWINRTSILIFLLCLILLAIKLFS